MSNRRFEFELSGRVTLSLATAVLDEAAYREALDSIALLERVLGDAIRKLRGGEVGALGERALPERALAGEAKYPPMVETRADGTRALIECDAARADVVEAVRRDEAARIREVIVEAIREVERTAAINENVYEPRTAEAILADVREAFARRDDRLGVLLEPQRRKDAKREGGGA